MDKDSVVKPLPKELEDLIRGMPSVMITPTSVLDIGIDTLKATQEKMEGILQGLKNDKEKLMMQLRLQQQQLKEQISTLPAGLVDSIGFKPLDMTMMTPLGPLTVSGCSLM